MAETTVSGLPDEFNNPADEAYMSAEHGGITAKVKISNLLKNPNIESAIYKFESIPVNAGSAVVDAGAGEFFEIILNQHIISLNITGYSGTGVTKANIRMIQDDAGGKTVQFPNNLVGSPDVNLDPNAVTILNLVHYPNNPNWFIDSVNASVSIGGGVSTGTVNTSAPVLLDDFITTGMNQPLIIEKSQLISNDTDADNNNLTLFGVSDFNSCYAELNLDESISYVPNNNFTGPTSFVYYISDGGFVSSAQVIINVGSVAQLNPAVTNKSVTNQTAGAQVFINTLAGATDADGSIDPTTVKLSGTPAANMPLTIADEGMWTINPTTGGITFSPVNGFSGTVTPVGFTVKDDDGNTSNQALISISYLAAETPVETHMALGINSNWTSNWDSTRQWVNLAHNIPKWDRFTGTGSFTQRHGIISSTVSTDEFRGGFRSSGLKVGTYTVTWGGSGFLSIGSYSTPEDYNAYTPPGTFTFTITESPTGGVNAFFKGTSLTSLSIVHADNVASYNAGNEWDLEYIAYIGGLNLSFYRFMNSMEASSNVAYDYAHLVSDTDISYALGVPISVMADLCNQLSINPWFNIPARSTPAAITAMSNAWKQHLNFGLILYVELGNELGWNFNDPWAELTRWIWFKHEPRHTATKNGTIYTKNAHGLTTGKRVYCFLNINDQLAQESTDWRSRLGLESIVTVLSANTFSLQRGGIDVGLNGTQKYLDYIDVTNATLKSNINYAQTSEQAWNAMEAGGMDRVDMKYVLSSHANNASVTTERMAALTDPSKVDFVSIAPYYQAGFVGSNTIIEDGKITPAFYNSHRHLVHATLYPAVENPSIEDIVNGVGGAINHQTISPDGSSTGFTEGTGVTNIVLNTQYKMHYVFFDESNIVTHLVTTVTNNVTGSTIQNNYGFDTYENQRDREIEICMKNTVTIDNHGLISGKEVALYEMGYHQHEKSPSQVDDWLRDYWKSPESTTSVKSYLNHLASSSATSACWYKDASITRFGASFDRDPNSTDARYSGLNSFNGYVERKQPARLELETLALASAPANSFVSIFDFSQKLVTSYPVTYSIPGDQDAFAVDTNSGILTMINSSAIDFSEPRIISLPIKISGNGFNSIFTYNISVGAFTYTNFLTTTPVVNSGLHVAGSEGASSYTIALQPNLLSGQGTYPTVLFSGIFTEVPNNGLITISYVGRVDDYGENKQLEIYINEGGFVKQSGSLNTQVSTIDASYSAVYKNTTGAAATPTLKMRFNNILPESSGATAHISQFNFTIG